MVPKNLIKPVFDKFANLTDEEFTAISELIEVCSYTKKVKVIEIGMKEESLHWVAEGLLRKYFYFGKNEVTTEIAKEGDFICSFESFAKEQPSAVIVETIENSKLFSLSKENVEWICDHFPRLRKLYFTILAEAIIRSEKRSRLTVNHIRKDIFIEFMTNNRDLVRRVPQILLASYLNLAPETFSRYKHLIRRKQKGDVFTN